MPDFNLVAEKKNQTNAQKADGAILKNKVVIAVIELKGTNTKDLESIRKQAFDYKANQKECVYIITSNFEKLRFYINDATEFVEFNLFNLNEEEFALCYLCLSAENILNNLPLKIKEESVVEEEKITKQFYADYSIFKRELFRDLVKRNAKELKSKQYAVLNSESPAIENKSQKELLQLEKNVKRTLFKKSQKLIDRFLFIFFAEDRNLLPPNSVLQIVQKWKNDKDWGDEKSLYGLFKQYFHFLDTGRKETSSRAEIFAYNGGLFKSDTILDTIEIDDELLFKHTQKLSAYDFESQVDVNILGHIFENSLNEIESVNAEIDEGDFDKQKSKRKKDGIFYTPKYITKYIVENTVGKLCAEKKEALGFKEEEYYKSRKGRQQNTLENLLKILNDYRAWLLQLTICDPACGSGAFLNQALDFLIREHHYLDELKAKLLGGGLVLSDIEKTILENNIYGVDLNEESVEIAKLSLWLRTAQPRRKLNDLSSNIKCGNSLIDSKAVAGDKAFNWETEFPQIFGTSLPAVSSSAVKNKAKEADNINLASKAQQSHSPKQGFDVVIGNPPYVRVQNLKYSEIDFYKENYSVAHKRVDISLMFFELGFKIIKDNGLLSYITSIQFVNAEYGRKVRELLLNYRILEFIDFNGLGVFEEATTYPGILLLQKSNSTKFNYYKVNKLGSESLYNKDNPNNLLVSKNNIDIKKMNDNVWVFESTDYQAVLDKLETNSIKLKSFANPCTGLTSGMDKIFILDKAAIEKENLEPEMLLPVVRGRNISRFFVNQDTDYVIYPYKLNSGETELIDENTLSNKFPKTYNYLLRHKNQLSKRKDSRKLLSETGDWYKLIRKGKLDLFKSSKILTPGISKENRFAIDHKGYTYLCGGAGVFGLLQENYDNYYLVGLLNSKVVQFFLHSISTKKQGGYYSYLNSFLEQIPIPNSFNDNIRLASMQNEKFRLLLNTQVINFIKYFTARNSFEIISNKLENWHELDFSEFLKELSKAIKKAGGTQLTKKEEFEWLELFEENKQKAQSLKTEIQKTEQEIDQLVYQLYNLTDEEIVIVENS